MFGSVTLFILFGLTLLLLAQSVLALMLFVFFTLRERDRWRREVVATTLAALKTGKLEPASGGAQMVFSRDGLRVTLRQLQKQVLLEVPGLAVGWELRSGWGLSWMASKDELRSPLGDTPFDRRLQVRGSAAPALALLDPVARAELRQVMNDDLIGSLILAQGRLTIVLRPGGLSPAEVSRGVERALEIGALLRSPSALWERLLERLGTETNSGVVIEIFLALLRAPEEGVRSRALALAAGSETASLRLARALYVGDLESAEREIVAGGLNLAQLRLRLGELVPSSHPPEVRRGLGLLLVRQPNTAAQTFGAKLLGRVGAPGDVEVEQALIALAEDSNPELLKELSYALGVVGSLAAIPALSKIKEQTVWGTSGAEMVDAALRVVRARLAGAEAGTIRLADERSDEGAFRVSTQGGDLSLVEEAPPRPRPAPLRQG